MENLKRWESSQPLSASRQAYHVGREFDLDPVMVLETMDKYRLLLGGPISLWEMLATEVLMTRLESPSVRED